MPLAHQVAAYNRDRKWQTFLREFIPSETSRVLDVGYNAQEYSSVDNYIEKHYPYQHHLKALGLAASEHFNAAYPWVEQIVYDGSTFPFRNKAFDICWSNAVIEHVGDRQSQVYFLMEIHRVAKSAFVTTPNRNFPIEVHTRTPLLHFLPKRMFERFLIATRRSWATGNYMNLLTGSDLKGLLADAQISNYRIVTNKLGGFVLDFVVIID